MIARRTFVTGLATATLALGRPAVAGGKVNVFAAASLKNALDEASAACTAASGQATTNTYAASSALAKQIEQGAPADLFISADLDWMSYLADRHLIVPGSAVKLLGNRLVLIAPAASPAQVSIVPGFGLAALLGGGRLAMADVRSVPAGRYGKAALERLGVWASVENSIAQAENVRAALKLVSTGEAPVGIVYATDAQEDVSVRVLGVFPAASHPPIIYPAAVTAASTNAAAADVLSFLRSAAAQAIFRAHGFTDPGA